MNKINFTLFGILISSNISSALHEIFSETIRFTSSHKIMKAPLSLFVGAAFGILTFSNSAQAVVLITFAQDGSNVTATLSGSLRLPEAADRLFNDNNAAFDNVMGTTTSLFAGKTGAPFGDIYGFGQAFASGLSQSPDSFSGPFSFGYNGPSLTVVGSSSPEGTVTPTGTWTWNNTTLAGIGLGSLTTTPVVVYETGAADRPDTIRFVAVPEPSTALLGLGASALLFRRRRK
jgi:hypothetical protein